MVWSKIWNFVIFWIVIFFLWFRTTSTTADWVTVVLSKCLWSSLNKFEFSVNLWNFVKFFWCPSVAKIRLSICSVLHCCDNVIINSKISNRIIFRVIIFLWEEILSASRAIANWIRSSLHKTWCFILTLDSISWIKSSIRWHIKQISISNYINLLILKFLTSCLAFDTCAVWITFNSRHLSHSSIVSDLNSLSVFASQNS